MQIFALLSVEDVKGVYDMCDGYLDRFNESLALGMQP